MSTSTVASSTSTTWTTTTTLPAIEIYVGGTKLSLADNPRKPNRRRLYLESNDRPRLVLEDLTAPFASGGSLRIVAIGGDGFDKTYPLPSQRWKPLNRAHPNYGVRYRDPGGPITDVLFRTNGVLQILGKGLQLEQGLDSEPALVQVELRLGNCRYCLEFGGHPQLFEATRKLLRKRSLRPFACPAAGSADGVFVP